MSISAPTVCGNFNARFSPIESLVDAFIPSDKFSTVANPSHTIVLGPRGSGKTYLLKMLQPAALAKWRKADAVEIKSIVSYIGVYIPTDISWSKQAEQLGKPGLSEDYHRRLQEAAFTSQVLLRLLDTICDCVELKETAPWANIQLDFATEANLVSELSSHWHLAPNNNTLSALKQKLATRTVDIWRFGRQETLRDESGRSERFAENPSLNYDFVEEVCYAIGLVNECTGKKNRQWALLFDELEIAPSWLVDRLYPKLRSTLNQNIFFKFSLSPFTKIRQEDIGSSPRQDNDFELVTLSYLLKSEATPFSKRLLGETLQRKCGMEIDLYKVFGSSPLKPSTKSKDKGYAPGSRAQRVLKLAAENDPGFAEYINDRAIDLDKLDQLTEDIRAAEIRKIYPIVLFRQEFLRLKGIDSAEASKRSRKKPDIYSGLDSFLEMLEGNPRWIVGAVDKLAETIRTKGRVAPSQQYDYVKGTAERFLSLLQTIPLYDGGREDRSLGFAIEAIGDRIADSIRQDRFTSEPFGSFRIDDNCPTDILDSIGIAMNAGAIIMQSDADTNWVTSEQLRGKEFRMSYLFSPYKRIPFRLGRSFPLSEVLTGKRRTSRSTSPSFEQPQKHLTGELDLGL